MFGQVVCQCDLQTATHTTVLAGIRLAFEFLTDYDYHLTLKIASAQIQVVETSVANNSLRTPITQMIIFNQEVLKL